MNMEVGTKERRLAFLRRMIWWMPVLAFAVVTVVAFTLQKFVASDFVNALVNALIPGVAAAIIVAIVVFAAYYIYNRFVA
jgi:uncharacterized membrane protein YbhN (UPF0104 family)